MNIDQSQIIQRLRDDDQSALSDVLKEIVPKIMPLLVRKFGEQLSYEDLEEVIGTSLGKLWQRRSRFDSDKGDLEGWFYVICRNTSLDLLRKRAPKVQNVLIVEPVGTTSVSPEEHKHVALKIIQGLSEREQQVLLPLFNRGTDSVLELARQLDISENAVRQLRFRATQKLKKQLLEIEFTVRRSKVVQHSKGN